MVRWELQRISVLWRNYKSAFVLLHKLPEAMAEEMRGRIVGGEGKTAEIDGRYFGGHVKPANQKEYRRDRRRLQRNQNGKRKVVVVIRERGGKSVPAVFHSESQASAFIRARIATGTVPRRPDHGTTFMSVSKSNVSTIKKHTRLMARAQIGRKSTAAVSAALKLASTITLRELISSATRKKFTAGR
jgi:hypothetical protein